MDDLPPPLEIVEEECSNNKDEKREDDVALIDEMMRAVSIAKEKKEKERERVSSSCYYSYTFLNTHVHTQIRRQRRRKEDKRFGSGMKGGFFNRKKKKKKKKEVTKKKDTIPVLRPAAKKEDKLRISEVQEAMSENAMNTLKKGEWVNDDLMKKIRENPTLLRTFSDPRFRHLAERLQSNPKAVIQEAQRNPELKEFLNALMSVLGTHFKNMGEHAATKQTTSSPPQPPIQQHQDPEVKRVLEDPELRALLMDPKMKEVLQNCSTKPGALQYYMSIPDVREKLQKMARAGLIQLQ